MHKELSINIKTLRKEHGYKSAQAFADALHVHLKAVQGWENKDHPKLPTLDNLVAICDLLGCDLDYLVGRLETPTHDIKFIRDMTGLSVEAIEKLIENMEAVKDSPLSDIIVHNKAARLLQKISVAADCKEKEWNMINDDVGYFMASQELTSVLKDISDNRKEKYDSMEG